MSPEVKTIIEENLALIDQEDFLKLCDITIKRYDYSKWVEILKVFREADIEGDFESIMPYHCNFQRIKKIKCYNVGFGDCFLCKNEVYNSVMLVDCGTHSSFINSSVTQDICQEFSQADEKSIMISHLHQDHYNGIADLFINDPTLKINNLYLPNYISNGSLEILAEVIFTDKHSALAKAVREILMIPGLFSRHFENGAKIHFLSENGLIKNKVCRISVLLPRKNLVKQKSILDNSKIEAFCKEYVKIFRNTEDAEGRISVSVSLDLDYGERISQLISDYLENNEETNLYKDELDNIKNRFNTRLNSLSLAFDEWYICEAHNVLFLGDAENKDIEYVCNTHANNSYKFVKISHHGTRNYFYQNLPKATYYAISNGAAKDSWEISARYDCRYGRSTCFICSNNQNCELHKNRCSCNSIHHNRAICGFSLYHEVTI